LEAIKLGGFSISDFGMRNAELKANGEISMAAKKYLIAH
jgi:hypothetical protein